MTNRKINGVWPSEFYSFYPSARKLTEEEEDMDLLEEINIIDVQLELLDDDS